MKISLKLNDIMTEAINYKNIDLSKTKIHDNYVELSHKLMSDTESIIVVFDVKNESLSSDSRKKIKENVIKLLTKNNFSFTSVIVSNDNIKDICDRNVIDFLITKDDETLENIKDNPYIEGIKIGDDINTESIIKYVKQKIDEDNYNYQNNELIGIPSIDKPHLSKFKLGDFKKYQRLTTSSSKTQLQIFYEKNMDFLDEVGLVWEEQEYTYKDMFNHIEKVSKSLIAESTKADDIVGICGPNVPNILFSILAVQNIGAIPSLYHPYVPKDVFSKLLELEKPKTLIMLQLEKTWNNIKEAINDSSVERIIAIPLTHGAPLKLKIGGALLQSKCFTVYDSIKKAAKSKLSFDDRIKSVKTKIVSPSFKKEMKKHNLVINWDSFIKTGKHVINIPKTHNDISVMVHTSGTSGIQKSAILTHEQLNKNQAAFEATIRECKRGDTILAIAPMFHILGLNNCVSLALRMGVKIILASKYDEKKFHKFFEKNDINFLFCVPTIVRDMLKNSEKYNNIDFSNLKYCYIGGEEINKNDMQNIQTFFKSRAKNQNSVHIGQSLGATEHCCSVSITDNDGNNIESLGKCLINVTAKVVDPTTKKELGYNQEGELYFHSYSIMSGYYENEEATDKVIEYDEKGDKWLHLGDYGKITEKGDIYFSCRADDIIKIDGEKVDLQQLKIIFYQTEMVDNVMLFPIKNKKGKIRVGSLVILKTDYESKKEEFKSKIVKECSLKLGAKYKPEFMEFVHEFPKTLNLKNDSKKIREEYFEQNFEVEDEKKLVLKK
ncbi:MAG: AMP-binding protein [bacterium]|nr:AMP-binding protein [bacterium]